MKYVVLEPKAGKQMFIAMNDNLWNLRDDYVCKGAGDTFEDCQRIIFADDPAMLERLGLK
jgi:hypothetical protein